MLKRQNFLVRICFILLLIFGFTFSFSSQVHAEPPDELDYHETFLRAKVLDVVSQKALNEYGSNLLNSQTTIEEIIRAVVGSAALILAVPITTIIASYIALNRKKLHTKMPRLF